jgi:hypothetical protein
MQPSPFGYLKPTIGVAIVDLKISGWPAVVLHIKDQRALSARQQGSKM